MESSESLVMNQSDIEAAVSTLDKLIQVFAVLVAIGIVGEVGFGVRHWILTRRLHTIQNSKDLARTEEIARLNKEAGDARKDAGKAIERAASAEARAAEAQLELAKFKAPREINS